MVASSSSKAIGVQVDLYTHLDLSKKLQSIWSSPGDQKLGKGLISKLFADCSSEFCDLFGLMSINTSAKPMGSLAVKGSNVELQYHMHSCPSPEAAKVSHLYSVLTKVLPSDDVLYTLLDKRWLKTIVSYLALNTGSFTI